MLNKHLVIFLLALFVYPVLILFSKEHVPRQKLNGEKSCDFERPCARFCCGNSSENCYQSDIKLTFNSTFNSQKFSNEMNENDKNRFEIHFKELTCDHLTKKSEIDDDWKFFMV